jgi:alkylation response protein AidB-like acyl-CoA dehydrogenase
MDFAFSTEHEDFRKSVRAFAESVIAPRAREMDEREEFPVDIVRQMGQMGLFGLPFPERYGGSDSDFVTVCIAVEELARVDSSMAATLEAGLGLGSMPVYMFGTEEQKQRWLTPLARGEALAGFGLTEPDGGSDSRHLRTKATLQDGRWMINGSKAFITNSGTPLTMFVIVAAVTGSDGTKTEVSNIIVPNGTPGFTVGRSYRKIGWHASDTHELAFDECAVPEENLLGDRGAGHRNFLHVLDGGRVAIGALAVGLAQGCLEQSIAYAKERRAFGHPIAEHQAIAFKLADMAAQTDLARLGVYRAAWMKDQGMPFKKEASIAKLFASDVAVTQAREAVQIHGGYGYIDEFAVSRFYRDSKILEIGEGTSEVQRMIIAREILGP